MEIALPEFDSRDKELATAVFSSLFREFLRNATEMSILSRETGSDLHYIVQDYLDNFENGKGPGESGDWDYDY